MTPDSLGRYPQTSLGGGAVGFAPYQLYWQDCSPASGSSVNLLSMAIIRHYGGVIWDNTLPMPYLVRRVRLSDGQVFDVTASFEIDQATTSGRAVAVKPKSGSPGFLDGSRYEIVHPNPADPTNRLSAEGVPPAEARTLVADYTYTVTIP